MNQKIQKIFLRNFQNHFLKNKIFIELAFEYGDLSGHTV